LIANRAYCYYENSSSRSFCHE